jgi:hypothetical protein
MLKLLSFFKTKTVSSVIEEFTHKFNKIIKESDRRVKSSDAMIAVVSEIRERNLKEKNAAENFIKNFRAMTE